MQLIISPRKFKAWRVRSYWPAPLFPVPRSAANRYAREGPRAGRASVGTGYTSRASPVRGAVNRAWVLIARRSAPTFAGDDRPPRRARTTRRCSTARNCRRRHLDAISATRNADAGRRSAGRIREAHRKVAKYFGGGGYDVVGTLSLLFSPPRASRRRDPFKLAIIRAISSAIRAGDERPGREGGSHGQPARGNRGCSVP